MNFLIHHFVAALAILGSIIFFSITGFMSVSAAGEGQRRAREDAHGYNPEQQKASDYIQKITKGQVGSGDDPVGFIIASHAAISRERAAAMLVLKDVMNHDYLMTRFEAALKKVIDEE